MSELALPQSPAFVMPDWPWYGVDDDMLPSVGAWHAAGMRVVLATLARAEGSSPRPVGSEMAIAESGGCTGYVSGGCVEAAVVHAAMACLDNGAPLWLDYGNGSPVLDLQLTCGGRVHIFVRELSRIDDYLSGVRRAREERHEATVLTNLSTGAWRIVPGRHSTTSDTLARSIAAPLRLVVVGADPVALAVASQAVHVGFEVVLLRPNGPSAPPPNLGLTAYHSGRLEAALASINVDGRTAVYTFAHDDDVDVDVLAFALRHSAFAAGALGSRRKTEARVARLLSIGFSPEKVAALFLPAGTKAPAATSPRKIAATIIAQILSTAPGD